MYKINKLRETFLIQSSVPSEVEVGVKKIAAQYPSFLITTFNQNENESIVQVWCTYYFNE